MKALVLKDINILKYEEINMPTVGEYDILVRVKSACICNGSDPAIICGATWSEFPAVMGHEAYGEIVDIGSKVTNFKIGDNVCWWFCMGAFAEYVSVDTRNVAIIKTEGNINKLELPIMELVIAAYRIFDSLDVHDKHILIIGQGPAGLIISQLCLALGAKLVTAWELNENRKKISYQIGCNDYEGEFDTIIDAYGDDLSGDNNTINNAVMRTKKYGELVLFGHPINGRNLNSYLIQSRNIKILLPTNDIEKIKCMALDAKKLYMDKKINLKCLITRVISFEEILDSITNTYNDIKIIVDMEGTDC